MWMGAEGVAEVAVRRMPLFDSDLREGPQVVEAVVEASMEVFPEPLGGPALAAKFESHTHRFN